MLKIPVIVHESDLSPGLANKICFKYADKICLSFEETKAYIAKKFENKLVFTGNPVRKSILKGSKEKGLSCAGFSKGKPVLLIMGGSQGAMQINELLFASADELLKDFQIVHIVGKGNLNVHLNKKGYKQFEYLDEELKDVLAMSDMVVTRGGANSLFELKMLNKKVLVIPLSAEVSRGDQIKNAELFARKAGFGVLEGEISQADFVQKIKGIFKGSLKESRMKNGVDQIVKLILSYSK